MATEGSQSMESREGAGVQKSLRRIIGIIHSECSAVPKPACQRMLDRTNTRGLSVAGKRAVSFGYDSRTVYVDVCTRRETTRASLSERSFVRDDRVGETHATCRENRQKVWRRFQNASLGLLSAVTLHGLSAPPVHFGFGDHLGLPNHKAHRSLALGKAGSYDGLHRGLVPHSAFGDTGPVPPMHAQFVGHIK